MTPEKGSGAWTLKLGLRELVGNNPNQRGLGEMSEMRGLMLLSLWKAMVTASLMENSTPSFVSVTEYQRLGGLSNKHFVLTALEARSQRSGHQQGLVLEKDPPPSLQMDIFLLYT